MRMHPKGVKNALPAAAPVPIAIPIVVMTAISALPPVAIAFAAMTSENVCKPGASVGPATVPTPVTRVMTVNEFRTLVPVPVSPATSLSGCVG